MSKSFKYDPDDVVDTPTDEFIRRRTERKFKGRWDDEFFEHQSAQSTDKRASLTPRHHRRID